MDIRSYCWTCVRFEVLVRITALSEVEFEAPCLGIMTCSLSGNM